MAEQQYQSPVKLHLVAKKFLFIFLPLAGLVVALSAMLYYLQHVKAREQIVRTRETTNLGLQQELIGNTIRTIVADLRIIASLKEARQMVEEGLKPDRTQPPIEFSFFSQYKGIYDQVRMLDRTGMEVVRVDLKNDTPYVVPADQLQFKGKRYYFKDTFQLNHGEIFMSPLDLNVEHGEIERPPKPMIRFGTPLFDSKGEKQGVLLLNYLGKKLLTNIEKMSMNTAGQIMLLNTEGYWLKGATAEDEWGFMYKDRSGLTFGNRFPEEWREISIADQGQLTTDRGLFTFVTIYPLLHGLRSTTGAGEAFAESKRPIGHSEYAWKLVSHVSRGTMRAGDFMDGLLFADLILLILLGVVSWFLALANVRRRQVEEALRNAYEDLDERIRERTAELARTNEALSTEILKHRKAEEEKDKIELQLRQAQKMEAIGTLAGGIAHDFNNILTPILGYTDLALQDLEPDSKVRSKLEEVAKAGDRAKELVKQILAFSRQTEHDRKPIQLHPIIKEALKLLRSSIPSTIEIRQNINSNCGAVLADPTQIHQVLMNLCTNSYHAMRDTGGVLGVCLDEVEIGPEDYISNLSLQLGRYLKLEVSDTGTGIHKNIMDRIFEPYFTTKKKGEGTGMGLAVVHGIVKSHNGHLTVYSEPGKGTTFHIYLPEIETKGVKEKIIAATPMPTGKERVMIVDDEEQIVMLVKEMLEKLHYRVTALTSSIEALQTFRENPADFDLVITDMTMPNMTGSELTQELLQIREDIPVILCTGFSEIINGERAKAIGIRKFIMKPILMRDLAESVRKVLDSND